jgi:hypothetical protein
MNIYFLVEGLRTEMIVYPKWLQILLPDLNRVLHFRHARHNDYYMFSGHGFPSLLHSHLKNCLDDINDVGNYDYFVICLDSDDKTVAETESEIFDFMHKHHLGLHPRTQLKIIVQQKCVETWFLGNPKIFNNHSKNEVVQAYADFYNVKTHDPELMLKPNYYLPSVSMFHVDYLTRMLRDTSAAKMRYSKRNPTVVCQDAYLRELIKRSRKANGHLASFRHFHEFCLLLHRQMQENNLPNQTH